jgi:hypothetical protein
MKKSQEFDTDFMTLYDKINIKSYFIYQLLCQ